MAGEGNIAGIGGLLQGGFDIISALQKSDAVGEQTEFTKNQLALNRELASIRAAGEIQRGEFEKEKMQEQTAQIVGGQRAAQAAQGVKTSTGTAKTVQEQTAEIGAKDYATIANNAWLQSFGFKLQGENEATKSTLATLEGRNAQTSILDQGAIEFYSDTMRAVSDLKSEEKSLPPLPS